MYLVPLSKLNRATLPPEMIIDGYIENYRSISYEEYLTEYINQSSLFLNLSEGKLYKHTPKDQQSHAECDCCSEQYELDFKLLGTQSSIYAKRNLSMQKYMMADGVITSCIPRQTEGMNVAITNGLLQRYSLDDLCAINQSDTVKFDRNNLSEITELKAILKIAKCKKNTLFFYTDFIFLNESFPFSDIIYTVEKYMNDCFSALFMFRNKAVPIQDTYFAVIIQGFICIAIWDNQSIHFKDCIPLSKSSIFLELYNIIDEKYKRILLLR